MNEIQKAKMLPFKKGHIPWNKGFVGLVPWNKGLRGVQIPWNKGQTYSPEYREKLSLAHRGKPSPRKGCKLSQDQIDSLRKANLGRTHSNETRLKRGRSLRGKRQGEKCNFWKGGIEPLRNLIRDLGESTEWRWRVFNRDSFTCKFCEVKGGRLEAHHLKRFADILQDFVGKYSMLSPINDKYRLVDLARKHEPFWDVNNGLTLCVQCHKHTKGVLHGRSNRIV